MSAHARGLVDEAPGMSRDRRSGWSPGKHASPFRALEDDLAKLAAAAVMSKLESADPGGLIGMYRQRRGPKNRWKIFFVPPE